MTTAKTYYKMGFPIIISRITIFVQFFNVLFSATLKDKTKIAAIGLANSILCIFGQYFMLGFLVPLETLTSQAYGAGNMRLCGVYLNRALVLLHVVMVPIFIILWNSEAILLSLG